MTLSPSEYGESVGAALCHIEFDTDLKPIYHFEIWLDLDGAELELEDSYFKVGSEYGFEEEAYDFIINEVSEEVLSDVNAGIKMAIFRDA